MSGTDKNHAVVVGAGLTGLVTGYHIAAARVPVTVYETAADFSEAQGLLNYGGTLVEPEFDPILRSDDELLRLLDELGAATLLEWHPATFAVRIGGCIQPLGHPRDLRSFRRLGFFARFKLARRAKQLLGSLENASEDMTAERWLDKQMGKELTAAFWNPVIRGFWGRKSARVSAAWLARRLGRISSPSVSGDGTSGYVTGSLRVLADRLQKGIEDLGGRVIYGTQVQEVLTSSAGLMGVFIEGQVVNTSAVVLSQRPDEIRALSPGLPESFFERLEVIPFQSQLRLNLELDRDLGTPHHLLLCDEDLPFNEVVSHSAWVGAENCGDRHLAHLTATLSTGDPELEYPEEKLVDLFFDGLQQLCPGFDRQWVKQHRLDRDVRSRPVPVAGSPLLAPVSSTPIPGIYLASEAAHGRRFRGPSVSAVIGREIAGLVIDDARSGDGDGDNES